jgi:formate hydrogenlyase subunit 3/multisubunit Na+/H+ antiporter MnhD subunit
VNPIPGPILLLALPLLAAGVTYVVRRLSFPAALLSTLTTAGLAILCFQLPLDRSAFVLGQEVAFGRPVVVLGQTLVLDAGGQAWLAFVFALAPVLYLFAWRITQGRSFYPFSLLILSLYALVTLLQSFELSLIVFAISTTLGVFIIQAGQPSSVRGAQRYLTVTLLAVPFLLAASWLLDNPVPGATLRSALLPAALGFGLLLAAFPFGTWMPALAAGAPPMVAAFIFAAGQAMALYLGLIFLRHSPTLLDVASVPAAIRLAGLVMAASGGIMAAVQRDFGRLFGYAALSDLGVLLMAFGPAGSQGLSMTLLYAVYRGIAIVLMASALAILRHRVGSDRFSELRGVARRLPITTMGLILGGLALAGFPFTAGFPLHWAVYRNVWSWAQPFSAAGSEAALGQTWIWVLSVIALLASSAGIATGVLRGLSAMLGGSAREDVARQPALASLVVLLLAAFVIFLGMHPQLLVGAVSNAAQAFLHL